MKSSNKPTIILKIGGSILTYKDQERPRVRRTLLAATAREISQSFMQQSFRLIIIHGVGSFGHRLAKTFELRKGTLSDQDKWIAAFKTHQLCQLLHQKVALALSRSGLPIVSFHPSSFITQNHGKISKLPTDLIKDALEHGTVPILYGDMVSDSSLGMSVCSGDALVAFLARKFQAKRILFASDIDGIYTKDPYRHKDAQLIESLTFEELAEGKANISSSHSVDVTDGLQGKLRPFSDIQIFPDLQEILVFNGSIPNNYSHALTEKDILCTKLKRA